MSDQNPYDKAYTDGEWISVRGSSAFSVSAYDTWQAVKLGLIVFVAAGCTAVAEWATQAMGVGDLGEWAKWLVVAFAFAADFIRRWATDTTEIH